MEEYDLRDVAYEKINRGYGSQWDLMADLFAWLDLRLYFSTSTTSGWARKTICGT